MVNIFCSCFSFYLQIPVRRKFPISLSPGWSWWNLSSPAGMSPTKIWANFSLPARNAGTDSRTSKWAKNLFKIWTFLFHLDSFFSRTKIDEHEPTCIYEHTCQFCGDFYSRARDASVKHFSVSIKVSWTIRNKIVSFNKISLILATDLSHITIHYASFFGISPVISHEMCQLHPAHSGVVKTYVTSFNFFRE